MNAEFIDTNVLIYAYDSESARESGSSVVWSEDLNSGQDYAGVRVQNPFS